MTIKATMFFEQQVGDTPYGWTESVYDSTSGNLPAALEALRSLARYRAGLLGWGVSMPQIRVSDPLIFRDSQIDSGPNSHFTIEVRNVAGQAMISRVPDGEGNVETANDTWTIPTVATPNSAVYLASNPNLAVLVRMEGGTTYQSRRSMLLRGNPAGIFSPNQTGPNQNPSNTSQQWTRQLARYTGRLISQSYGFYGIDMSGANPLRDIAAITITAGGNFTATLPTNTPPVGAKIRISGTTVMGSKGPVSKAVNRVWTVSAVSGAVCSFINGNNFPPDTYLVLNLGKWRLQSATTIVFNKFIDIRYSNRKTGRPFFLPRGRRSNRRLAG